MKGLIAALAILFTASAFSYERPNPDMSWKKLRRLRTQQSVFFVLPQYQLSDGFFLWADKVCLDGEELDIIMPTGKKSRKKCVRWAGNDEENRCAEYKTVYPKIAVKGTRYGCLEWGNTGDDGFGCIRWGQKPYEYKTEFDIKVTRHSKYSNSTVDHQNYGRFLFNKDLNLPACVDVD